MTQHEYTPDAPLEWSEGGHAKGTSKFPVNWPVTGDIEQGLEHDASPCGVV